MKNLKALQSLAITKIALSLQIQQIVNWHAPRLVESSFSFQHIDLRLQAVDDIVPLIDLEPQLIDFFLGVTKTKSPIKV